VEAADATQPHLRLLEDEINNNNNNSLHLIGL
jgi:hypothetical protein